MKMDYQMYTKEVLKNFKHPKNMGVIANPDGVGKVGNKICGDLMQLYIKVKKDKKGKNIISDIRFQTFGCLPQNERVLINEGDWENVENIRDGNTVLNSNGKKTNVLETYMRNYKGKLFRFVPFVSPYNSFFVTPEHPILCIKRMGLQSKRIYSKKCSWLRINEMEVISTKPEFIEAENVEVGDYLIFVPNSKIKDSIVFTENMMKLLGYYLSEGYVVAKNSVVAFALNKNEKENIDELEHLIFKITKKKPKSRIRRNVIEIYICSRKWANFFISECGKLARHKKISKEILLLPFRKQWKMIETYIKGDGDLCKRRKKDSPTYRIATASENLAIQTQEILARGVIFSSIRVERNKNRNFIEGRKVDAKELYVVSFKLERKHKFVHYNNRYFLVPVKKIERTHYEGNVYNFHVKGKPESYLVKGFAVHNCVAAISTSSMITSLAKGKTLDEALKITRSDVASALGGLPAVKQHCSVLAADALTEAIYDYLLKNKLPISDELKKSHERIQQQTKEVEEKFKDYVHLEKKIWKVKE